MGLWGSMLGRDASEDGRETQRIEERPRTEITKKSGECQSCRAVKGHWSSGFQSI